MSYGGDPPFQLDYDASAMQANLYFFVGGQRIASYARFGDSYYLARWVPVWLTEDLQRWGTRGAMVVLLLGAAGMVALAGRRRRPAWLARAGIGFLGGVMVLWPLRALPTGGSGGPSTYGGHGEENGVFYLTDHLGSTRAVINAAGAVVETRDYDPFGRDIAHTGDFQLKHRFTGQPVTESDWEAVAPLYDYGARFYDPRWGRFLSPDAFVERLSSQGMNRYAYVGSQPTSRIDPTGNFTSGGDGGGLGGGGAPGGGLSGGFGGGLSGLTATSGGLIFGWGDGFNWGWEEDTWGLGKITGVLEVFGVIFGDARREGGSRHPRDIFGELFRIAQLLGPTQIRGGGRAESQGEGPKPGDVLTTVRVPAGHELTGRFDIPASGEFEIEISSARTDRGAQVLLSVTDLEGNPLIQPTLEQPQFDLFVPGRGRQELAVTLEANLLKVRAPNQIPAQGRFTVKNMSGALTRSPPSSIRLRVLVPRQVAH